MDLKVKATNLIKKIQVRQAVFIALYVLFAFVVAFMIKKCYHKDYHGLYYDMKFIQYGDNYVSEAIELPACFQKTTIVYSSQKDIEMVIAEGDGQELTRDLLPVNPVYGELSWLYEVPNDTSTLTISFLNSTEDDITIHSVDLLATESYNNDGTIKAVIAFLIFMCGLVVIMLVRYGKISREQLVAIVVLAGAVVFISSPAFLDYIPRGHDLGCHTGRIDGMKEAMLEGQLMPMVIPTAFNGYGILSFVYPELFLYVPALLRIAGATMVLAYHVLLFLINIATAVICYISVKSVLKHCAGKDQENGKVINISVISTLLYLMSTYRLSDTYIRAALGETLAMIFLPLVVAGLYHLIVGDQKKWYMLAIGVTGIVQSHVLTCFLIIPLIVIIVIPFIKYLVTEKRWIQCLYTVGAFLVLNLWYIIPFVRFYLLPLNTANLVEHYVSYHMVLFSHLFAANLNTSFEDGADFTLAIGTVSLLAIIISAWFVLDKVRDTDRFKDRSFKFMTSLSVCFTFVLIISSELLPLEWIEEKLPVVWACIQMLQFPYRFLTIASICLVFMMALALLKSNMDSKYFTAVIILVAGLCFYDSSMLIEGYEYSAEKSVKEYSGGFTSHMPGDYLPGGVDLGVTQDTNVYIGSGEVTSYEKNGTHVALTYHSDEDTVITVPLFYYPCYKAELDGAAKAQIYQYEDKRIGIIVPAGDHTITLRARYSLF